jgi:transcriptional regulator with XRE-family HTH domain
MSQLRLATTASMSPRYVSFVETGRSRPSRNVVLRLADALAVPLRERNAMLVAAGIAPAFAERTLDDDAMEPFRRIVETMLAKHDPYPAFALDREYRILRANAAASRLLVAVGYSKDAIGADWIDAFFSPQSALRASLENLPEVGWAMVELLRREADHGGESLHAILARLEEHMRDIPQPRETEAPSPMLCPRFRFGDQTVSTVTTIARFGTARDITLDELQVELVFPADDASARFFEMMAGAT